MIYKWHYIRIEIVTLYTNWKSAKGVRYVWRQTHIQVQKALLDLSILKGATVVSVILLELWPEYVTVWRRCTLPITLPTTHCLILSSKQHFFFVLLFTSHQVQVIFTKCTLLCQYWGATAWGKEPACHQTTRRQAFASSGLQGDAATLLPSPQSPVMCNSGVSWTCESRNRWAGLQETRNNTRNNTDTWW